MEKKKHEKPIVLDLNGNTASGGPLSCVLGGSASGMFETCVGGTGATSYCSTGSADSFHDTPCAGGNGIGSGGDCMTGTLANGWCEGGAGNINVNGYRSGPSGQTWRLARFPLRVACSSVGTFN
jgi:hypothetical protein